MLETRRQRHLTLRYGEVLCQCRSCKGWFSVDGLGTADGRQIAKLNRTAKIAYRHDGTPYHTCHCNGHNGELVFIAFYSNH